MSEYEDLEKAAEDAELAASDSMQDDRGRRCPCPECGSTGRCECEIRTESFQEDALSDDQGTVWRTAVVDWCHTHRCEVEEPRRKTH